MLARAALSLLLAVVLFPVWSKTPASQPQASELVLWVIAETAFGVFLGLGVSLLLESFALAAQIFGLGAGYAYATMIDPTSEADSGILQVMAQLAAGLLFFALGLDGEIVRALGRSFEKVPPGSWVASPAHFQQLAGLAAAMWATALGLALPLAGLMLLLDLAIALVGRIQSQLQLLSLAFPVKMLATLWMLALLAPALEPVFGRLAERFLALAAR